MKNNLNISPAVEQHIKEIMDVLTKEMTERSNRHPSYIWFIIKAIMLKIGLRGEPGSYSLKEGMLIKEGEVVARDIRYDEKEDMLYFTFRPETTVNHINITGIVIN